MSAISLTPNKIPWSRGFTDKNNARSKGNGACWKGRREANCAERIENPDEIDNHTHVEGGNREMVSIKKVGGSEKRRSARRRSD